MIGRDFFYVCKFYDLFCLGFGAKTVEFETGEKKNNNNNSYFVFLSITSSIRLEVHSEPWVVIAFGFMKPN